MSAGNRTIVAMLVAVALAVGFWVLLLGPKRQQASELEQTASTLKQSLAADRATVDEALAARKSFPRDYQRLVVLGKAVPSDDETASLLVPGEPDRRQCQGQVPRTGTEPQGNPEAPAPEVAPAPVSMPAPGSAPASPTEAAAAALPLGASVGPAGLDVMPYSLKFSGGFFHVADFIKGLDSLVKTENSNVKVDGRLITMNGFSLSSTGSVPFPTVEANFAVTTYLTPPDQGATAGRDPGTPAPGDRDAGPAATLGGTP